MKMKRLYLIAAAALALAFFTPFGSHGETQADSKSSAETAAAVIAQQKTITDNQAKIDTKLAEVAEELRLARIYISRGK
jgi:hypothetical protein